MVTSPASTFPRLKKLYQRMVTSGDKVALDLRNVTFVDRAAMEFLSKATSRNVSIENTPSYVKRWIEQEVS